MSVDKHGTFIQISLPQTFVPESGKFYDGNSPFFRIVTIFQFSESVVGIRLFITQETKILMSSLSIEYMRDQILTHLDHKSVKPIKIDDSPPVEEIIAKTKF